MTDTVGNEWTWQYDLRGHQTTADDPDAGTTTMTYDDAGQLLTTSDARGETIEHHYDQLGRITSRYDGEGTLLAEWEYDTAINGIGMLATSTRWHDGEPYTFENHAVNGQGLVTQKPRSPSPLQKANWPASTGSRPTTTPTGKAPVTGSSTPVTPKAVSPPRAATTSARRRLMAIDGTSFDVPDSDANVEHFGRAGSGPKASAFPKLQVMALAECGTRAIVAAVPGGARAGERTLAAELVDKLEPDMLVTADAGLYSWELFNSFADTGTDLLWRIGASVSVGHLRWLADGSYLALIYRPGLAADRRARLAAAAKTGAEVPAELARLVRVVEYTVPDRNPDGELIAVITTILDPRQVDALELAAAYQQRWEEESAIDEVKTDLRGRGQILRSKTPELVEQELWGLLLAHYGIRALLTDAADEAGYDPDRTSFIRGLRVVRRQVTDQAAISP